MSAPCAHGQRRTYQRGCRCVPCKAANADYERNRRHEDDGSPRAELWVSATRAHLRLHELRAAGVGYRQAARIAGLSPRTVAAIASGRQLRIEPDTERRILGLKRLALAHGQRVSGWREWRLIASLRTEGMSDAEIARRLGYVNGKLQIGRPRMTVRNALRIRLLYQRVNAEGDENGNPR